MRNWTPWPASGAKKPAPPVAEKTSDTADKALNRSGTIEAAPPIEADPESSRSSVKVSTKGLESDAGTRSKKTGVAAEKKAGKEALSDTGRENTPPHGRPEKAKDKTGKDASERAIDEPEEALDKKDSFKKHDHAAYVSLIKSKANEVIAKEPDCALARVCKNSITDEWSLSVYVRQQATFSFVSYAWDEIDEKWGKSYVSEKRPLSQWEHHLRFSSAGKECSDLKQKQR